MRTVAATLLLLLLACVAQEAVAKGPFFDLECARKCTKKLGYKPVCVDDGRSSTQGTMYPNACAFKCTSIATSKPHPHYYSMLPARCKSSVSCSLVKHQMDQCKASWLNPKAKKSPKVNAACECAKPKAKDPRLMTKARAHAHAPAPAA